MEDVDTLDPAAITQIWNQVPKENVEQYKLKVLSRRSNTIIQKPLAPIEEEIPDEEYLKSQ